MVDLKSLYESLGLVNVKTYIQSGNVIFESPISDVAALKNRIEKEIEIVFGFSTAILIRTSNDFECVMKSNPFIAENEEGDSTRLLVTFLSDTPTVAAIESIQKYVMPPEELVVRNRGMYLKCPNGYGKSKLSNSLIEKKLGIAATTRNWKTVKSLYQLSNRILMQK